MTHIEKSVGVTFMQLTEAEREAVDRIKSAVYLLSYDERRGSPTDLVTNLSVAIAAELRRAKEQG